MMAQMVNFCTYSVKCSYLQQFLSDSDYSLVWPATNVLTLNFTRRMDCILINITDDNIVEGTETFTVHFDETHGNMIMIAEEGSASVTITDNEGMVGF